MTIRLHFDNGTHRGPGKVVQNLIVGLQMNNTKFLLPEDPREETEEHACLQAVSHILELPVDSLIGPNIFVLPTDRPDVCKRFNRFVVPCQWVKEHYSSFPEMQGKKIDIWPVGIETSLWSPRTDIEPDLDCLIYFKNRQIDELKAVVRLCKKFNLQTRILQYGNYDEPTLLEYCHRSKFVILLTNTESQGIAYMQILSTNTPCYSFYVSQWSRPDLKLTFPETSYGKSMSTPYFDTRCGSENNKLDVEHFANFMEKLHTYTPREYILENHTLEKAAKKYCELL